MQTAFYLFKANVSEFHMTNLLSEALIITKCQNIKEIQDWLFWYVNVLGFDIVSLYDNESPVDVKSECDKYPNVEYKFIRGFANQTNLYLMHVNKRRKAQWVFPVDDDEFLFLSDKYSHSVNTFLSEMMEKYENDCWCDQGMGKVSVQWVNLVPSEYTVNRDKTISLLETHTYIADKAMKYVIPWEGRSMVGYLKTFVRDKFQWSYGRRFGQKCTLTVHNPSSWTFDGKSVMENGKKTNGGMVKFDFNPNAFLAHYSLRSDKEWYEKCHRPVVSSPTATMASSERLFKRIYEHTEDFIPCTLVRDLYNEKRKEFGMD